MSPFRPSVPAPSSLAAGCLLLCAAAASAQNVIELPDSLYATGDTVAWVRKVTGYCEGPAWEASTGYVYFTEQAQSGNAANWPIWRVKPGADTGIVWYNNLQSNGLYFDAQGRLVTAQNGRLTRLNPDGTDDSVLVTSGTNGVMFNQANDLSIGKNGAIYFTDLMNRAFYLDTTGTLSTATTDVQSANGIYWLEEEDAVYVHSAVTNGNIYRFGIDSATGALVERTTFVSGINTPDGGTLDAHGNRYVASYNNGEIRVFNAAGDSIGRIALRVQNGTIYDAVSFRQGNPGNASNAVFGGEDMQTLYITGDGGLFAIRLKVPGRLPQGPVSLRGAAGSPAPRFRPAADAVRHDLRGRALPAGWRGPVLKAP